MLNQSSHRFLCLILFLIVVGCSAPPVTETGSNSYSIYHNGDIITMEGDDPAYVEAVVEQDGKIVYAGMLGEAKTMAGEGASMIDLNGQTLLPGFLDGHGHAWNVGFQQLSANLLPPPDGEGSDIASLIRLLKEWAIANPESVKRAGWIVGFGYDDAQLAEKRHPVADELDEVSEDVPVILIHQSGHLASVNHKAMEVAGYNADTPNPPGGVIRRTSDGSTPNGVMEEMASFQILFAILNNLDGDAGEAIALAGLEAYKSYGYTTAQEGRSTPSTCGTWKKLADENRIDIDIAAYPDIQAALDYVRENPPTPEYTNHYRIAGVKLSLDGSPQGKTAWLTQPYVVPPDGQPADYRGYPAIPDTAEVNRLVNIAFENNWQVLAHCNGDAASDELIESVRQAEKKYGKKDRRPVMIHAQTVRFDQLDDMIELGILPSFFSMHTFYWGDWHVSQTLGPERAFRISPAQTAFNKGMTFTEHHDAPVGLPSSIMIMATAVNRTSRSGEIIGPDERISPYLALKSLTEWAAYQYFEEETKGTLTKGKLADMVIIDRNPLEVEPAELFNLKVMETIKEGKSVYKRE